MQATEQVSQARKLTAAELAAFIKAYRQVHRWSQEQLADIAGLSVRTIQRVEQGAVAGLDTRRAIAKAFEFDDIDALDKPVVIPNDAEMKALKEKFERENVTLEAKLLTTGRDLARLVEMHSTDLSTPGFEMGRTADEEFAELIDYFRDYRDCADMYSEVQKLEVYDDMQAHIDALKNLGVSVCYAVRKLLLKIGTESDSKPMPVAALYLVTFPLGQEPSHFATPRSARLGL
ncbi:helix-turn-helix domain-containing protein [Polaromonas sp. JS666]|uniref:helix-turn-helix domain-containing protein n=1 Tax=Polaromonas sp. (strain JS666 / ATCC BAA-500) TaxID=296591 RepID=UPI0000533EDC|nr:helix-turn-helix transcriptional regulator [Polaromonas sp. JS666]ABE46906.1 transcriptional regulator, XRE family [Polaromonas sp. JS666]